MVEGKGVAHNPFVEMVEHKDYHPERRIDLAERHLIFVKKSMITGSIYRGEDSEESTGPKVN